MIAILAWIPTHNNVLFIIRTCCSFVFWHFKCLFLFLSFISWKTIALKVIPKISFLCAVIVIVVVVLLHSEWFLKTYYYCHNYSYCLWCEHAFWKHLKHLCIWQMLQLIHWKNMQMHEKQKSVWLHVSLFYSSSDCKRLNPTEVTYWVWEI